MYANRVLSLAVIAIAMTGFASAKAASTFTTLYSFKGQPNDGLNPHGKPLYKHGYLYGTTFAGGTTGSGIVFKINSTNGTETILYALTGNVGNGSVAGLIDLKGQLYGTVEEGGFGFGSVFTVNPTTKVGGPVYRFEVPPDAAFPDGQLLTVQNDLYGVTQQGGSSQRDGAIYKIDPSTGLEQVSYSFKGGTDGETPIGALISKSGFIFGTTQMGGKSNDGTIYDLNIATGTETVLYSFLGGQDGQNPDAGLVAKGGDLYGTTYGGGAFAFGTVFKFDRATGAETVMYSFKGSADGANPVADLLLFNGSLYGTTSGGGSSGYGTVFAINLKSGAETVLYSFTGGSDGAYPEAGLIYAGGKVYGTTESGGASQCGTVFQIDP